MNRPAKEWMEKAEEDFEAANRLIKGRKPLYNLVCFHAQQSAEKYIKAVVELKGVAVPKTHDLLSIVDLAQPELAHLLLMKQDLELLTAYAVAARYPGENATRRQAQRSLKTARLIRESIRQRLKPLAIK